MSRRGYCCGVLLAVLAVGAQAQESPASEPAKSTNWLVDGVTEKSPAGQERSKTGVSPAESAQAPRFLSAAAKPPDGTANPLSTYLKTWMSPQDYALLKAREADASAPGAAAATGEIGQTLSRPTQKPSANPYLVESAPKPATPAKSSPPNPASAIAAATAPGVASGVDKNDAAAAKTAAPPPDVLKAQDDAKYFPQLKRF